MNAQYKRRWLAPEVIQTSLMDCGPAALACVLEGFGLEASYEDIRERCQTDVDGTSIDALSTLGRELGLDAHEVLLPRDAFLLPEADCLPAIVVTRTGAGALHFLVVWRALGPWVQVMDPGAGRRWMRKTDLLDAIPDVDLPVGVERFRAWSTTEDALAPLRAKMRVLGVDTYRADAPFAALDAAVRMTHALVTAGAISRGPEASLLVASLIDDPEEIPKRFWWAQPRAGDPKMLTVRGAVVVHFAKRLESAKAATRRSEQKKQSSRSPLLALAAVVREDRPRAIALLALAIGVGAVVTMVDALLFRGILDVGQRLVLGYQRTAAIAALLVFGALALALDAFVASLVHRIGRGLELRLRAALLEKIPRLHDRWLRTRPTSDLASRGHATHLLREVPQVAAKLARAASGLVVTTAAIAWLDPRGAVLAIGAAICATAASWVMRRPLAEATARVRTHAGALERFTLDALLGAIPIRVHGAERAVRREHESILCEWARSARALHGKSAATNAAQTLVSTLLVIVLTIGFVARGGPAPAILLLAMWSSRLPAFGGEISQALVALRDLENVTARVLGPLGAAETRVEARAETRRDARGTHLWFERVSVVAGGNDILRDVSLLVAPGSHVGIVGASGAGKSSLLALLLGFLDPSSGRIEVDGAPLDVAALRARTAWVDPAVHVFARSLFDNVAFGASAEDALARMGAATSDADLGEVLDTLPDGMQSALGEGGSRISAGQAQRVRLARALVRREADLALLDEPFRGLPRERRRALLERVRARFSSATMLLVSHDVADTLDLDRVIVIDGGRIVEDDAPRALLARRSRYRDLVRADADVRNETWRAARFRRAHMIGGRVEVSS
jgi:ATP-binding cassette subfamily B protein